MRAQAHAFSDALLAPEPAEFEEELREREVERWFFDHPRVASLVGWGIAAGEHPEGELVILQRGGQPIALPRELGGRPVRAQFVGAAQLLAQPPSAQTSSALHTLPLPRPVPWGARISHLHGSQGSLGCLAYRGDQAFLLSNCHVIANNGEARLGDAIVQPPMSMRPVRDAIAYLSDYAPVRTTATHPLREHNNTVDAAIARLREPSPRARQGYVASALPAGPALTSYRLTRHIPLGLRVCKLGGMTGRTEGVVKLVRASFKVPFGDGIAMFRRQLLTSLLGEPGDSGSLVFEPTQGSAVGLLFGQLGAPGCERLSMVSPIESVQRRLAIRVAPRCWQR